MVSFKSFIRIAVDKANFMGLYQLFVPPNSIGRRKLKISRRIKVNRLISPNQKSTWFLSFNSNKNSIAPLFSHKLQGS